MKRLYTYFYLFILLAVMSRAAYSHPHVFIKTHTNFVFSANTLSGIEAVWTFDTFFSSRVIRTCDKNRDKKLSPAETRKVFTGFFSRLKSLHYFIYIWINNHYFRNVTVSKFRARINADRTVTYTFFVKINTPLTAGKKTVKLMYKDKTIFCAFHTTKGSTAVKGIKPRTVHTTNNKRAQYQVSFSK